MILISIEKGFKSLETVILNPPSTALGADMYVRTLSEVLHVPAEASSPIRRNKKSKEFPAWNERVAAAVKNSKDTHFVWKRAGRPRGNSDLLRKKKEARKCMRQVLPMSLYQQKQDLLVEIMDAKDCDVRLFHRLIRRQRTIPNAATQILLYNGETLTGTKDIASGFASHFESLATPSENEESDADQVAQMQFDLLLLEEGCRRLSGSPEAMKVTPKEISGFIKSFKYGKEQDVHGLAAKHLKNAVGLVSPPLADLVNLSSPVGTYPRLCWKALLLRCKRRTKIQRYQLTIEGLQCCLWSQMC